MHVLPRPHDGVQERAAIRAVRVVEIVLAVDEQFVRALGELELPALDPAERLERRAGRSPAVRAVAVRRVEELVDDPVTHGAALALAVQHRHEPGLGSGGAGASASISIRGSHSSQRGRYQLRLPSSRKKTKRL